MEKKIGIKDYFGSKKKGLSKEKELILNAIMSNKTPYDILWDKKLTVVRYKKGKTYGTLCI